MAAALKSAARSLLCCAPLRTATTRAAGSLLRDEDRQEIEDLTRETLRVFQAEILDTLKVPRGSRCCCLLSVLLLSAHAALPFGSVRFGWRVRW